MTPPPLATLRVLDLSRVLAGPFCTMLLADLGADVIKVEQPGRGDDTRRWGPPYIGDESTYYLAVNRNKRSLTLDLKQPRGRELLLGLVRGADALVENFKVGTMERMGLGYERLREVNPGLVYCAITGFGPDGPYRDWPGYDLIAQGMGGLMSITGQAEGEPMKVGVAAADLTTGLYASTAILAALRARDASGQGQRIDVSLLESVVASLINVASSYLMTGQEPTRHGNAHPNIVPYQVFQARDRPLIIGVGNDEQFSHLCQVLGRPELAEDQRYATNHARVEHRERLVSLLADVLAKRDAADWLPELVAAGVPSGPINSVGEVFANPQVLHRHMLAELPHPTAGTVRTSGIPFKLSETPATLRRHPPLLGEHTDEILKETLGLPAHEVARHRSDGVV